MFWFYQPVVVSFIFVIGHSIKKSFFCVFLLPKLILSIFHDFKTVLNVPKYYYHSRYYEEVFKSNTSFYIKVKKRLTLSFCMCFLLVNVGVSTWTDRLVNEVRKITASATFFNLVPRGPTPFEQGSITPTKIGFAQKLEKTIVHLSSKEKLSWVHILIIASDTHTQLVYDFSDFVSKIVLLRLSS